MQVYNEMSFQNYHSIKLKNMELIKKYGPKNYNFPHHVAHYRKHQANSDHRRYQFYEPPGYQRDIASGQYRPDTDRPQDVMPPDYLLEERHESRVGRAHERRFWRRITRLELVSGQVSLTSKLRLPVVGTRTG